MFGKLHYVYRAYRYRLRDDLAELRYLASRLQPGNVAVDIGAHKGAYTYWMRRQVGRRGAVIAFEPQPTQIEYLRRVFSAMRYSNVTLAAKGVSSSSGQLPLRIPAGDGRTQEASFELPMHGVEQCGERRGHGSDPAVPNSYTLVSVTVTTLDEFFKREQRGPDFIKNDVEGHESAILEGARETLARYRPTLLIECEARHRSDGDVQTVFRLLESHGYRGAFFSNGRRRPLGEFDLGVHQRAHADSRRLPAGYVSNFAFEAATREREVSRTARAVSRT